MMRRQWVDTGVVEANEFTDAFASVSLLPGPASTQLALWLGWRLRGYAGLLAAAGFFITPAVALVLFFSWLVVGPGHPVVLEAAALGAAAVVPAVALRAAVDLGRGYKIAELARARQVRLSLYVLVGIVTCILSPLLLVVAMILSGVAEIAVTQRSHAALAAVGGGTATKGALAWMALKVGALSFGGGFVIVPLMHGDAVSTHHWMTAAAFSSVVAIGQLTPGPVVATVAGVGYAAGGLGAGVFAALVAFTPSILFVGAGARHLTRIRQHPVARAFLDGAGPAATGAIVGSAYLLLRSCTHPWQWPIAAVGALAIVAVRRSPTVWLLAGTAAGLVLEASFHVAV